jgi:hypothetical protein
LGEVVDFAAVFAADVVLAVLVADVFSPVFDVFEFDAAFSATGDRVTVAAGVGVDAVFVALLAVFASVAAGALLAVVGTTATGEVVDEIVVMRIHSFPS